MYLFVNLFIVLFMVDIILNKFLIIQSQEYTFRNYSIIDQFILSNETGHLQLDFVAFSRTFRMILHRDVSLYSQTAQLYFYIQKEIRRTYLRNVPEVMIYKGTTNISNDSIVFGYMANKIFVGRIDIGDEKFYVEPLLYHNQFKNTSENVPKGIIYNLKDIVIKSSTNRVKICENLRSRENYHHNNFSSDFRISSIAINNAQLFKSGLSCSLELVADSSYFKNNLSINPISEMIFHVMSANYVFQNLDLDGSSSAKGIKLSIAKISIFYESDFINQKAKDESDKKTFLKHLSSYRHPYCMLIWFTSRDFYSKKYKCQIGGVKKIGSACSDSDSDDKKNENVGFVTNIENSKKILRFRMSYNLIRQLGHAFNCQDDPVNDTFCSPGDINRKVGNYVMHPKLSSISMPNNWKFSICCLRMIKALVTKKVYCFKKVERSICGNGIVEEGESCDCGSSISCLSENSCCIPKDKPFQCSLKTNRVCWPENDQCCDESCEVLAVMTNKTCFSNEPCYNASNTCNGGDPLCPGKIEPDASPCFGTSRTCKNGRCISNVCKDHGMQLCECSSIDEECHICCKNKSSTCKTAKSLNFFTSNNQLYLKMEFTSCNSNYGFCSLNGTCLNKGKYKRFFNRNFWKVIGVLLLIAVLIIGILVLPTHEPSRTSQVMLRRLQRK